MIATDRIPRNDAIETVGRAMFKAAWVGELTDAEFDLIRKFKIVNGTRPPVPPELTQPLYIAEERGARADRQYREVIHWLEDRGLDCVAGLVSGLDRVIFDQVFSNAFGAPAPMPSPAKSKYRHPGDATLVREGVEAIRNGLASNPFQAARLLYGRAEGSSDNQKIDRLRKSIGQQIAKDRQS